MQKRGIPALVLVLVMALTACGAQSRPVSDVDYAKAENWAWYGVGEDKAVDVFFICPTVDTRDEWNMSLTDEKTKTRFLGALKIGRASCMERV